MLKYQFGQKIGEGTFAQVYIGVCEDEQVAIKVLQKESIKTERDKFRVKKEMELLQRVNHPNIVKIKEVIEDDDSIYLITEYVSGGELFDYIVEQERLCDDEARHIMRQLIDALDYLHKMGIIHRDLKPENILMRDNGDICLIDFGLSMEIIQGQLLVTPCGSPCYAAPEMLEGRNYDGVKTDIWSCGVILYAMLCGYLPFDEENTQDLYEKIKACQYTVPKAIGDEASDIIKGILSFEDQRISIAQIKVHPWLNATDDSLEQINNVPQINNAPSHHSENNDDQEQPSFHKSVHQEEETIIENVEPIQTYNKVRKHTLKRESIMSELEVNIPSLIQSKFQIQIQQNNREIKTLKTIEQAFSIIQESSRQKERKITDELKESEVRVLYKPAMKINTNRPFVKSKQIQSVRFRD